MGKQDQYDLAFVDNADESGVPSSDHSRSTSMTNTQGGEGQSNTQASQEMAASETRAVYCSKLIVLLILAGATVVSGYFTYVFVKDAEQRTFEGQVRTTN